MIDRAEDEFTGETFPSTAIFGVEWNFKLSLYSLTDIDAAGSLHQYDPHLRSSPTISILCVHFFFSFYAPIITYQLAKKMT